MTAIGLSALAVLLAYLIGAIPFAYLVVYWAKGVDIRTVGSGNVGATNAGRVLGFRFFLLVFALDLIKGLLPTLGLPRAVAMLAGHETASLPVFVALGTILGHNFPVYLRFRGGKGVATSLGALFALDAAASASAAVGFVTFLLITKYVSLSSVLGGFVWVLIHFYQVENPWKGDQIAMSVLSIGLLGLLIVRHRKNFSRIAAGTEPKVTLGKKNQAPGPSGCARPGLLAVLATTALLGAGFAHNATRQIEVDCGPYRLIEVARAATGHQRADRVVFADRGRLLAVTCPRYNRLVLYRVSEDETLVPFRDLALEGRPVALQAAHDRLYVLQRPAGDAQHVEHGYWETYDFEGRRIGAKFRVGFYPDDMVLTRRDRLALVLTSGRSEGDPHHGAPALLCVDLDPDAASPRVVSRTEFADAEDNPEKVVSSLSGSHAAVVMGGSKKVVGLDLIDPETPRLTGRVSLAPAEVPYPSVSDYDFLFMPVDSDRESIAITPPPGDGGTVLVGGIFRHTYQYLLSTVPDGSALEFFQSAKNWRPLGRMPLRGVANLGTVRPTGLAYDAGRGLVAVANRSGGVHLIALRSNDVGMSRAVASADDGPERR
jgi:acyl-phosphate glycerol 3-phosphate acyltransferase